MKVELCGRVSSGHGEGKKYVELAWVKEQISEKLGFNPYRGTLNLRLDEENVKRKSLLTENAVLKICREGFCNGLLFRASIYGLDCGVVIPQVKNYPDDELEIIAGVNLRQKFGLHDSDRVEVTVLL